MDPFATLIETTRRLPFEPYAVDRPVDGLAPGGALRSDVSGNGTSYDALVSPTGLLKAGTWYDVAPGSFELGAWEVTHPETLSRGVVKMKQP